eukprot:COSAG01_NODE_70326_length_259_cov_0.512500_1_plen_60_part_10
MVRAWVHGTRLGAPLDALRGNMPAVVLLRLLQPPPYACDGTTAAECTYHPADTNSRRHRH